MNQGSSRSAFLHAFAMVQSMLFAGAVLTATAGPGAQAPPAEQPPTPPAAPIAPVSPAPATAPGTAPATAPASAPTPAGANALIGLWRTEAPTVEKPFFLLSFERTETGSWTTLMSIPPAMMFDRPLDEAKVEDDGTFVGSITIAGAKVNLNGRFDPATNRILVKVVATRGDRIETEEITFERTRAIGSGPGVVRYKGELVAMGMTLPMAIRIEDAGTFGWIGAVDIPSQGVRGMPLIVNKTAEGFTVIIPAGVPAVIRLVSQADGAELAGSFVQGTVNEPIKFTRSDDAVKGSARPQEPKPPFPYIVREVVVPTTAGHQLAGTLTLPQDASTTQRVPGIVMLTGSGLQDRDELLMGHKPFLVIADALTRAGFAVLRCDDRGFGFSTGDGATATTSDFADDGRAAMAFLRVQAEVDAKRCGYLGHSEGGLTGPLAAQRDQDANAPVAFVAMLAGPGVTGAEILPLQMRRLLVAAGGEASALDAAEQAHRRVLEAVVTSAPKETQALLVAELISAQQRALIPAQGGGEVPPAPKPDSPEVMAAMAQLDSPWMREFLTYDPAPALRSVRAPMLAMNGGRDTQVVAEQNLPRIEAIRQEAGLPITIKRYDTLNHLFQPAVTGGLSEYAVIETTFDPQALADLVSWIHATTSAPAAR